MSEDPDTSGLSELEIQTLATQYACDEVERLTREKQADRMAITKALALIQYVEDCGMFLPMFILKESVAFREASEAIRSVANVVGQDECNTCFGTGKINGGLGPMVTCSMCHGTGVKR